MTTNEIIATQRAVGTTPDGFWGPKSEAACRRHLRSLMPKPHPFPKSDVASVTAFYGACGQVPTVKVASPFPITLYDGPTRVHSIEIHAKLEVSLMRVFTHILDRYPSQAEREATGITKFFGSYVVRNIRGSVAPSKHSWAVAIDFDYSRNGNYTHWPTRAKMPLGVMECFAREGWLSAGAFWGRDAMHFEATH